MSAHSSTVTPPDDGADAAEPSGGAASPDSSGADTGARHHGADGGLTDAGMVLSKAVLGVARVLLRGGRRRARKAAESGRVRLDLRQLRRDRDVMYQKLGREVVHLVEGGEVSHPGLVRGMERIRELDARIAEVEAELQRRLEADRAAAAEAGDVDANEENEPTSHDDGEGA